MTDIADDDHYLVWSQEHHRWWGPARCGYVRGISQAGRYSRDVAMRICLDAMGGAPGAGVLTELPVREADAIELAERCPFKTFLGELL